MKTDKNIVELAISEYLNSKESLKTTASKYGKTGGWLLKNMKKRNIQRRNNSEWKININKEIKAVHDYKIGMPVAEIAKKYNISRRTVTEWYKKNGIAPKTLSQRIGINEEVKNYAIDLYLNKKMNCCEISRKIGVSSRSVLEWVKNKKRTKSEISAIMAMNGQKKCFGKKGIVNTKYGLIRYDSNYERDRIVQLCDNENVVNVGRCKFLIKYDNKKNYNPDFLIEYKCGCKVIEEVKPKSLISMEINQLKFNAAYKFCKEKGYLFYVTTEKEIYGK